MNGDADKIGQVVANFISNAIKYAPGSHKIDIKIFLMEDRYAAVSITDYGIGIAASEHSKIFNRFYRVEGAKENKEGFGIGLFLAKTIIENHQGYITVESIKGQGSTFTFCIPVNAPKFNNVHQAASSP